MSAIEWIYELQHRLYNRAWIVCTELDMARLFARAKTLTNSFKPSMNNLSFSHANFQQQYYIWWSQWKAPPTVKSTNYTLNNKLYCCKLIYWLMGISEVWMHSRITELDNCRYFYQCSLLSTHTYIFIQTVMQSSCQQASISHSECNKQMFNTTKCHLLINLFQMHLLSFVCCVVAAAVAADANRVSCSAHLWTHTHKHRHTHWNDCVPPSLHLLFAALKLNCILWNVRYTYTQCCSTRKRPNNEQLAALARSAAKLKMQKGENYLTEVAIQFNRRSLMAACWCCGSAYTRIFFFFSLHRPLPKPIDRVILLLPFAAFLRFFLLIFCVQTACEK